MTTPRGDAPSHPIEVPATEAGRKLLDISLGYMDQRTVGASILAIETAARDEGRQEARDAMRTRIGTAHPHFPQAVRLRLYTLIDEVAGLNASESPPVEPLDDEERRKWAYDASESPPTPRLDKQRLALAVQTVHDYDDDYEAVEEADEIAAAYAGAASESGQPPDPEMTEANRESDADAWNSDR